MKTNYLTRIAETAYTLFRNKEKKYQEQMLITKSVLNCELGLPCHARRRECPALRKESCAKRTRYEKATSPTKKEEMAS